MAPLCMHSSVAFTAESLSFHKFYDNACSFSMVRSLTSLLHVEALSVPFLIGGIGGSALYATHSGLLKGFPPILAKAYWGPKFDVDLVSLGYLVRCGGSYVGAANYLSIYDPDGNLLDKAPLMDNNLSPLTKRLDDLNITTSQPHAFSSRRFTVEEIAHMNVAEELHIYYGHPGDDTLIEGINYGHIPTHITAAAVYNNRQLRGPCPHCIAGKLTNDPMPPSLHEPESVVAQTLSTDVHKLPAPTHNGNTHKSNVIDHKTGHLGVVAHKSKHTDDMIVPLQKHIAIQYNAHGFKVDNMLTDAEAVYSATKPSFGKFGIIMQMTPPNQHAQRVERYTRTADEHKRAILSGLTFVLPDKYEIYADLKAAKGMNDLPNSLTSPLTPTVVVEGSKPIFHRDFPFLPFGATCMVQQYTDKIHKQAKEMETNANVVPKAELGVCMGEDPSHRGSYLFAVANGEVVPRRVIRPVNVHPWDWKRKFSPTAELIVPRVPRYNYNVQQGVLDSTNFVDPTIIIADPSDPAPVNISPALLHQQCDTSDGSTAAPALLMSPLPSAVPLPLAVVPLLMSPSVVPPIAVAPQPPLNADMIVPVLLKDSLHMPLQPMVPTPPVTSVTQYVPPVVPMAAPLVVSGNKVPVISLESSASSPELLRRSTRLRHPAVPGAHRSYIGTSNVVIPDDWISVGSNNKSTKLLRHHSLVLPALPSITSSTVPTETVHDLTITDAIAYLSKHPLQLSSSSAIAFAAIATAADLQPQASTKGSEKSFKQAMKPGFAVAKHFVERAVCRHLDMLTEELSTFSLIDEKDIQPNCIRVYAQLLIKIKADERVTARLAAGGNRQPLSSHGETFAPTASESSSNLLLSVYQAYGKRENLPVQTASFDLSNAFQNTILDKENFPQQILMLMPDNLPGKYASYSGKWVEAHKAINGLRQANELFDKDFRSQMAIAGFLPTCDPCVYHKQDPIDPSQKCSINMHVDDGLSVYTSHCFYQDAINQLTMRWGTLTHQTGPTKLYNGKNITSHSNGAISLSMESYITRAVKELGVAHLPPVGSPSNLDFFDASTDTTPANKLLYARFNGCLTHVTTKGRFDVRKESTHLSKQMSAPTEGDMCKMIQVWQYLNCTASMGPVYDTDEGIQLVLHVDTAFGVHTNGAGHTGAYLSIGRYNAPIWVMSKQQDDIALSPQATEYFGLSDPLQPVLWHRQLLSDLGFPQDRTIVYEDNIPAINLAYSPHITRKSRYMFVRHHFVRSLVQSKIIKICHVDSEHQSADLLTHSSRPAKFKRHRYGLLNLKALPMP